MLSKPHRLRTTAEYDKVYKHGRKRDTRFFRIYLRDNVKANPATQINALPRFGIVASKKVGNAVTRNRAKRMMREIVRVHLPHFEPNFEAVIVLFNSAVEAHLEDLDKAFTEVFDFKLHPPKSAESSD